MNERKLKKDGCNFYSIMQKKSTFVNYKAIEVTFPKVKKIRSYVARKYLSNTFKENLLSMFVKLCIPTSKNQSIKVKSLFL